MFSFVYSLVRVQVFRVSILCFSIGEEGMSHLKMCTHKPRIALRNDTNTQTQIDFHRYHSFLAKH